MRETSWNSSKAIWMCWNFLTPCNTNQTRNILAPCVARTLCLGPCIARNSTPKLRILYFFGKHNPKWSTVVLSLSKLDGIHDQMANLIDQPVLLLAKQNWIQLGFGASQNWATHLEEKKHQNEIHWAWGHDSFLRQIQIPGILGGSQGTGKSPWMRYH